MHTDCVTIFCKNRDLRQLTRNLKKDNYDVVSIEHVTRGKVVLVARDRFK